MDCPKVKGLSILIERKPRAREVLDIMVYQKGQHGRSLSKPRTRL